MLNAPNPSKAGQSFLQVYKISKNTTSIVFSTICSIENIFHPFVFLLTIKVCSGLFKHIKVFILRTALAVLLSSVPYWKSFLLSLQIYFMLSRFQFIFFPLICSIPLQWEGITYYHLEHCCLFSRISC